MLSRNKPRLWLYLCFLFVPEPKPVYAQPGQPDVDLPVSPSDAPVPSAAHDDSILRSGSSHAPQFYQIEATFARTNATRTVSSLVVRLAELHAVD